MTAPLPLLRLAGLGRLIDREVAERLGISEREVRAARIAAGIPRARAPIVARRCDELRGLLLLRGPMTRAELAESMGLTPRRVSFILAELRGTGLVVQARYGPGYLWGAA